MRKITRRIFLQVGSSAIFYITTQKSLAGIYQMSFLRGFGGKKVTSAAICSQPVGSRPVCG